MRLYTARRIANCCRRLAEAGLIAGADGNISVRIGPDRVLVTPSGLIKSGITAADVVEVDLSGSRVSGRYAPTSELDMHLRILRSRSDVGAVVHAHPPIATGFGIAGVRFDDFELPELIFSMGRVPLVPSCTPGTPDLGDAMEPFIGRHDAMVLADHGAVTMGPDLDVARGRMESLEHAAKMILTASLLEGCGPIGQRLAATRLRGGPPSSDARDRTGETEE